MSHVKEKETTITTSEIQVVPGSAPLAHSSIGGIDIVSIADGDMLTFSLNASCGLDNIVFGGVVGPTGFTILTTGLYQVNISLNVRNEAAPGTDQPVTVSLMAGSEPYVLPFFTHSVMPTTSTILVCNASLVVRFYAGCAVQLQNMSGASLGFDECTNFPNGNFMNRMFSITQMTAETI